MSQRPLNKVSVKTLNEALQSDAVRQALLRKGQRILPRTQAIAYSVRANAFAAALKSEIVQRPGTKSPSGIKRPVMRIYAEVTPEMRKKDGRTKLTRRQILRRGSYE